MKKNTIKMAMAAIAMTTFAGAAHAGNAHNFAIGLKASTLGAGVEAVTGLSPHFNLRGVVNGLNYSKNGTSSNMAYNGKLKLFSAGLLIDYLPSTNSNFRLTLGGLYNDNKLSITGTPTGGNYTINGHTYTAAQVGSINGQVKFNQFAPYVGIGYGNAIKDTGLSFNFDLGAMYQGSPKATLAATGTAAGLAADVAAQQALHQVGCAREENPSPAAGGLHSQRDREMGFAGADRPGQDHVLGAPDELAACQLQDLRPRHAFERRPVELVEGFDIGKARLAQQAARGALMAVGDLGLE